MNIAVLIKQVPDTYSERTLRSADGILDRAAADPVLDEISERAVEAALQLKEAHGDRADPAAQASGRPSGPSSCRCGQSSMCMRCHLGGIGSPASWAGEGWSRSAAIAPTGPAVNRSRRDTGVGAQPDRCSARVTTPPR
jgi:hypothetical protein